MGTIEVDNEHYWGAQTQRSLEHFAIGNEKMALPLIYALATIKKAAALINTVRRHLHRRQKQPQVIKNLFQEKHVRYAA